MEKRFERAAATTDGDEDSSDGVHELTGLSPATSYQVYMRSAGLGSPLSQTSDVVKATTEGEGTV